MGTDNYKCSCIRSQPNYNENELYTEKRSRIITKQNPEKLFSFSDSYGSIHSASRTNAHSYQDNSLTKNLEPNNILKSYNDYHSATKIQSVYRGYIFRKKLKLFNIIICPSKLIALKKKIDNFIPDTISINISKFKEPLNVSEGWKKYYDEEDNEINLINNELEGKTLLYTNGLFSNNKEIEALYIGSVDNKFIYNGEGKLYLSNGEYYEGIFNKGKLNGWGRYIDKMGNCYEGLFIFGVLTGKGFQIFEEPNNSQVIYEGEFKNFTKEGYGMEDCIEYIYEGNFKANLKHGQGKLQYKNCNDTYEGEFTSGAITGYGFYTWDNLHTYLGDFVDGKMQGSGTYKWPDGSSYKGDYVDNVKEGYGEFRWNDGRFYKGPFINGKPHGKGKLTIKNIVIEAEFNNGRFVGNLKEALKKKKIENDKIKRKK